MEKRAAFELIHTKTYEIVYEIVRVYKFVENPPTYSYIGAKMATVADLVLKAALHHELNTIKNINDANAYVYDVLQHAISLRTEQIKVAKVMLSLSS